MINQGGSALVMPRACEEYLTGIFCGGRALPIYGRRT